MVVQEEELLRRGRRFGSPAEYKAGLERVLARGWLVLHVSGTYVELTQAGAGLFGCKPEVTGSQRKWRD
jgi:hypothetical protein